MDKLFKCMDKKAVAPKDEIVKILKKIILQKLKVEYQEELCRLVLKELRKGGKNYSITPMRVRKLALSLPEIEVKVKTKRSKGLKKIDKCPVCESGIKPFKAKNLMNRDIVIGYECTSCGSQSDLEAFMPMKYIFIFHKLPQA